MEPFLQVLRALWDAAVGFAGADWKVGVLAGGVLLMWLVLGKLLAVHVFKSDRGHVAVFLGCLAPVLAGLAAWAAVEAYLDLGGFAVGGYSVTGAMIAGLAGGLLAGALLGRLLVGTKPVATLLFLLLVYVASAGGYLLAQASLTVFESGKAGMEQRDML